jgi:DNA-binding transcriptional LysR family regulator
MRFAVGRPARSKFNQAYYPSHGRAAPLRQPLRALRNVRRLEAGACSSRFPRFADDLGRRRLAQAEQRLVAFMRAYPEIILDLDFSDRVVDVIEEGFDAVVRFAEVGDSRLMTRALGTYRRRLVAAPAYLAAKGVPLIPDDLKARACLHHKFPTSGKFEQWPLWPEHAGIESELPRTAVASTIEPLICMAEQGLGIAYLPDFAIGQQLREGILVTVLDDYTDRSGPLRVLWPSSRHLAPKLRVFVDFLAANLVPAIEREADRAGDSRKSS